MMPNVTPIFDKDQTLYTWVHIQMFNITIQRLFKLYELKVTILIILYVWQVLWICNNKYQTILQSIVLQNFGLLSLTQNCAGLSRGGIGGGGASTLAYLIFGLQIGLLAKFLSYLQQ